LGFGGTQKARHIESGALVALKRAEIAGPEAGSRDAKRRLSGFAAAVRVQQEVASEPGRHWAAVHGSGETAEGAWCAVEYVEMSAAELIANKLELTDLALYNVAWSVMSGLLELKAKCRRAHGALKPANVLIEGDKEVAKARVVLTDPGTSPDAVSPQAYARDLHELGRLIYDLVWSGYGGWDRWNESGRVRDADSWRAFCEKLLNIGDYGEAMSLDEAAKELEKLGQRPRLPVVPVVVVGMLLVVGVVVAVSWLNKKVDPPPEISERLENEYSTWYKQFAYSGPDAEWKERQDKDEYLKKLLADVRLLNTERLDKVEALDKMEEIGRVLNGNGSEWEPVKVFVAMVSAAKQAGCEYVDGLDEKLDVKKHPVETFTIIDRLVKYDDKQNEAKNAWDKLKKAKKGWDDIIRLVEASQQVEDSIVRSFPAMVREHTLPMDNEGGQKDELRTNVERMLNTGEDVGPVADRVQKAIDDHWNSESMDRELFPQHSETHRKRRELQKVELPMLDSWRLEVADARFKFSPGANTYNNKEWSARWQEAADAAAKGTADLEQLERYQEQRKKGDFDKRLSVLAADVARKRKERVSPCRGFAEKAESDLLQLKVLAGEVRSRSEVLAKPLPAPGPADEIAGIMEQIRRDLALYDAGEKTRDWQERLDSIVALIREDEAIGEAMKLEWIQAYGAHIREQTRDVENMLRQLREDIPPPPREWEPLCDEYAGWFGGFEKSLRAADLPAWQRDDHLREKVLKPVQSGMVFDPAEIAGRPGADVAALREDPPDAVKRKDPDVMGKVSKALRTIRNVKEALAQWPLLKNVQEMTALCESGGWKNVSLHISAPATRFNPEHGHDKVVQAMTAVLEISASRERVALHWEAIKQFKQSVEPQTEAIGDPIIARFAQAVALHEPDGVSSERPAEMMKAVVDGLAELAAIAEKLGSDLDEQWNDGLDKVCFIANSPAHKKWKKDDRVTVALLEQWHDEVAKTDYRFSAEANPYNDADWNRQWDSIQDGVGTALTELGILETYRDDKQQKALDDELQKLAESRKAGKEAKCSPCSSQPLFTRRDEEMELLTKLHENADKRLAYLNKQPEQVDRRLIRGEIEDAIEAQEDQSKANGYRQELNAIEAEIKQADAVVLDLDWKEAYRPHIQQTIKPFEKRLEDLRTRVTPRVDPRPQVWAMLLDLKNKVAELQANDEPAHRRYSADLDKIEQEMRNSPLWAQAWPAAADSADRTKITGESGAKRRRIEELLESVKTRSQLVKDCLPLDIPLTNAILKDHWQKYRSWRLEKGLDPVDAFKLEAEHVREILTSSNNLPSKMERDYLPSGWDRLRGNDIVLAKQHELLRTTPDWSSADWSAEFTDRVSTLKKWHEDAKTAIAEAVQVERLLDGAWPAGDVRARYESFSTKINLAPEFKPMLNELTQRVESVLSLDGKAHAELLQIVQGGRDRDPALVLEAWRALGKQDQWPATVDEIKQKDHAFADVLKVVEKFKDGRRRNELNREMESVSEKLSIVFFAARAAAGDTKTLDEMLPTHLTATAPDWLKYDVELRGLRKVLLASLDKMDAADAIAQAEEAGKLDSSIEKFNQQMAKLPQAMSGRAEVKELQAALGRLGVKLRNPAPAVNMGEIGPGSAGWQFSRISGRERISYTRDGGGTLEFSRIRRPGRKAWYICTTEVSIRVFNEVVGRDADLRAKTREWLKELKESKPPRMVGPSAFDPRGAILAARSQWYIHDQMLGLLEEKNELFAEGVPKKPGVPTEKHPVHHVPAAVAEAVAKGIGCELPPESAWKAAYKLVVADPAWNSSANVRGDECSEQRKIKDERARKFDAGMFPGDGNFEADKFGPASVHVGKGDGELLFSKVDSGKVGDFHHLIGNVAEIVVLDGDGGGRRFGVAGASAFSPAELHSGPDGFGTIHDLPDEKVYFNDVGFRLAFEDPHEDMSYVIKETLDAAVYVGPGK